MRGRRGRHSGVPGGSADAGMVTLEVALAIPIVIVISAAVALLLAVGQLQARVTDAARTAAREVARGQQPDVAVEAANHVLPGCRLSVAVLGSQVTVRAEDELRGPGPLLGAITRTVTATVITYQEDIP